MARRSIVRGGNVFDSRSGTTAHADVVVEGGRIVDVGPGLDGDEVIEAAGCLVTPGFVDAHVHVMLDRVDPFGVLQEPFSLRFYRAARNLATTLSAGVTSVRDAAGADLGVKRAVETGLVPGPDIMIAVAMLSQTGGHADEWMPSGECVHALWPPHPGVPATVVDGPDEVRRAVRELVRGGADVLKVATTGGVTSPTSDPRRAHFGDDELAMLMAEAAAAGLSVMAHAQGTRGIVNAVRHGVRSVEHGVHLDDEAVTLMLEHGTFLVPTLSAPTTLLRQSADGTGLSEATRTKVAEILSAHRASVRLAHEAGVPIAMGTDAGIAPHGQNLVEVELLHEQGLTPAQALIAATRTSADVLGRGDVVGELSSGKQADIVVLRGEQMSVDGLGDRVEAVLHRGSVVPTGPAASPMIRR